MTYDTKDGLKCVLTAFLLVVSLIGIFCLVIETKPIYLGRVVSIDVESSGGSIGSIGGIRYYCLLDTGEMQSFISPKRIGESVYRQKPSFRFW